jgi:hypothetical protein
MSEPHHLDANVILRFLLADDPRESPKARSLFDLAQKEELAGLRPCPLCQLEEALPGWAGADHQRDAHV